MSTAPRLSGHGARPAHVASASRTIEERLHAARALSGEAMSPRQLRQAEKDLRSVVDAAVDDGEGRRRAQDVMEWYAQAASPRRRDWWLLLGERFEVNVRQLRQAQLQWAAARGTPDEAAAQVLYRRATTSPRKRLLQRFSADPDGVRFLMGVRAEMQAVLSSEPRLHGLYHELGELFTRWFDAAFLECRRITWESPAALLEKLIQCEALPHIRSWSDVKLRLDSKGCCYACFHPGLPQEPIVFVEVALSDQMAERLAPLRWPRVASVSPQRANTAVMHAIVGTQPGLSGVDFGDALMALVVERLRGDYPRLRQFATLSPIPGLRDWLNEHAPPVLLQAWEDSVHVDEGAPQRRTLMSWAARYLGQGWHDGRPLDPVARFHLGNGARVERLNWAADASPKRQRQSYGLMVSYSYDPKRLDEHRALLAQGQVPMAASVRALCG